VVAFNVDPFLFNNAVDGLMYIRIAHDIRKHHETRYGGVSSRTGAQNPTEKRRLNIILTKLKVSILLRLTLKPCLFT
jgi:hypothetical protein